MAIRSRPEGANAKQPGHPRHHHPGHERNRDRRRDCKPPGQREPREQRIERARRARSTGRLPIILEPVRTRRRLSWKRATRSAVLRSPPPTKASVILRRLPRTRTRALGRVRRSAPAENSPSSAAKAPNAWAETLAVMGAQHSRPSVEREPTALVSPSD